MNKRDLSISMARANIVVLFISIPVVIVQLAPFTLLHGPQNLGVTWNLVVFIVVLLLGIIIHELIHGVGWVIFGRKPSSSAFYGKASHLMHILKSPWKSTLIG